MNIPLKYAIVFIMFFYFSLQVGAKNKSSGEFHADTVLINKYLSLGKQKHKQNKLDSAKLFFSKALMLSTAIKDSAGMVNAYIGVGTEDYHRGDFKNATANWLSGLKIAELMKDQVKQLELNSNLSAVFLTLINKKKATYYTEATYKLAKALKDTASLVTALLDISSREGIFGNLDKEAYHLKEVIKLSKASKNYAYEVTAYLNLGQSYKDHKNYKFSLYYYGKADSTSKAHHLKEYDRMIYMSTAGVLYAMNKNKEALRYIKMVIPLALQAGASARLRDIYSLTSNIYSSLNKHKEALHYLRKSNFIKDSLFSIENEAAIHRMEIEHQSVKREKAISDQELIISRNKLELQEKNKYIIIAALATIILAAISVAVYLVYSAKHKADKHKLNLIQKEKEVAILEALINGEEKERSRLALELHDSVGGILSVTKMQMSILLDEHHYLSSSSTFEKTVFMLDTASSETRSIAHNLAPQILFQKGLNTSIASLCEKTNGPSLNVVYYSIGNVDRYNSDFELFIYRTVQEGLTNIIKHACAKEVIVQLSNSNNVLNLTIEDDGKGMDATTIGVNGMGLNNMRLRTIAKGGIFELSSSTAGTTIFLEFDITPYILNNTDYPIEDLSLVKN